MSNESYINLAAFSSKFHTYNWDQNGDIGYSESSSNIVCTQYVMKFPINVMTFVPAAGLYLYASELNTIVHTIVSGFSVKY